MVSGEPKFSISNVPCPHPNFNISVLVFEFMLRRAVFEGIQPSNLDTEHGFGVGVGEAECVGVEVEVLRGVWVGIAVSVLVAVKVGVGVGEADRVGVDVRSPCGSMGRYLSLCRRCCDGRSRCRWRIGKVDSSSYMFYSCSSSTAAAICFAANARPNVSLFTLLQD